MAVQVFVLALLYPSPVLGQCEFSLPEVGSEVLAKLGCGYRPRSISLSMDLLLVMGGRRGAP